MVRFFLRPHGGFLDAVAAGLEVRLLVDLIAGVAPETSDAALAELAAAGVELKARA